jgi:hypothetical protein
MKSILLFFFLTYSIFAKSQYSIGFGYAATHPLADFYNGEYKDGNGYDLHFLSKPFPNFSNIQIQVGADINYFDAGIRKTTISLKNPADALADYKVSNSHSALSFKTRFITRPNRVRFHADIDLGSRKFRTLETVKLQKEDPNYVSTHDSSLMSQNAFFTGLTTGIMYRITDWFYIDLYSRIDYGLSAQWFRIDSYSVIDDSPIYKLYDYKTTHTPLLWIGLTATFNIGRNTEDEPEQHFNSYQYKKTSPPSNTKNNTNELEEYQYNETKPIQKTPRPAQKPYIKKKSIELKSPREN